MRALSTRLRSAPHRLLSDVEQFDDHPPEGHGELFSDRVPLYMKSYLVNWLRQFVREHGDDVQEALKSTANQNN